MCLMRLGQASLLPQEGQLAVVGNKASRSPLRNQFARHSMCACIPQPLWIHRRQSSCYIKQPIREKERRGREGRCYWVPLWLTDSCTLCKHPPVVFVLLSWTSALSQWSLPQHRSCLHPRFLRHHHHLRFLPPRHPPHLHRYQIHEWEWTLRVLYVNRIWERNRSEENLRVVLLLWSYVREAEGSRWACCDKTAMCELILLRADETNRGTCVNQCIVRGNCDHGGAWSISNMNRIFARNIWTLPIFFNPPNSKLIKDQYNPDEKQLRLISQKFWRVPRAISLILLDWYGCCHAHSNCKAAFLVGNPCTNTTISLVKD